MVIQIIDRNTNEVVVEAETWKDALYQLLGEVNYGEDLHDIMEIKISGELDNNIV